MAETNTIAVEPRAQAGKGAARAARRAGRVPGVIYGDNKPPLTVTIEAQRLGRELRDPRFITRVLELDLGGALHRVMARAIQYHPVNDTPIHIDFLRVSDQTVVTVPVPVQFINEGASPGLKRGGVLNVVRREVEIVCLAHLIPEQLTIDLTGCDVGDSIHISAIKLPEGVRPAIADRDFTVATLVAPSGLKAQPGAAAS